MISIFRRFLLIISIVCIFSSCRGKIQPLPLYSMSDYDDASTDVVEVPFKEYGGVRTIQVKINDCAEWPMIFDTGCSGVSISVAEVCTLHKNGFISEEDFIGVTRAQIADGSIVENAVVNLRKIQIGDYECFNIKATISNNAAAPLLLGNGALKDVESFVVDDAAGIIRFNLK